MIDFLYKNKSALAWRALIVLCIWLSGYHYAADKADAKQTALITAYQNSSMAAAKQYADELKKAQVETKRWHDFAQRQSIELASALSELDKTKNTLQEQTHDAIKKDGNGFSGIGSNSLHLYNRAFGYPD